VNPEKRGSRRSFCNAVCGHRRGIGGEGGGLLGTVNGNFQQEGHYMGYGLAVEASSKLYRLSEKKEDFLMSGVGLREE